MEVIRVEKTKSAYGGSCYMLLFRDVSSLKTFRSWIYPACGNFKRWEKIIQHGKGTKIEGARLLNKKIVDADSEIKIVNEKLF